MVQGKGATGVTRSCRRLPSNVLTSVTVNESQPLRGSAAGIACPDGATTAPHLAHIQRFAPLSAPSG
jgi:hypothetical protein